MKRKRRKRWWKKKKKRLSETGVRKKNLSLKVKKMEERKKMEKRNKWKRTWVGERGRGGRRKKEG